MAVRRWLVGVSLGLAMISGVLWFGGQRVVESNTRPSLPASVGSAGQGAKAFYAASFGGLSMDALASNAVPWHLTAAAVAATEIQSHFEQAPARQAAREEPTWSHEAARRRDQNGLP